MKVTSELEQKFNEAMVEFLDTMINAKDFAIGQLPDTIEQILSWKMIESLVSWSLCMTAIIICLALFTVFGYRLFTWKSKDREETSSITQDSHIIVTVVGGFGLLIFLITLAECDSASLDWLQIMVAPKSYILDYIVGLKQ